MALRLVPLCTDSDGPSRPVYVNPEFVATVEVDMAKPDTICHVTLMSGQDYRIKKAAGRVTQKLQNGI